MLKLSNSLFEAGASTPPPSLPTTTLRVAEVSHDSVRLGWNPLQGATGYILRWGDASGDTFFTYKYDVCLLNACCRVIPFKLSVCVRYWSRGICYTACFVQLLPGDRAAFRPSISLHCAANLCKWIRKAELCRWTHWYNTYTYPFMDIYHISKQLLIQY